MQQQPLIHNMLAAGGELRVGLIRKHRIASRRDWRGRAYSGQPVAGMIVEVATWSRWFVHVSDCEGRQVPPLFARVQFVGDEACDPRGPRAYAVRVIAPPIADVTGTCRDCLRTFAIDPVEQSWYVDLKQLSLPSRCAECRQVRAQLRQLTAPRNGVGKAPQP